MHRLLAILLLLLATPVGAGEGIVLRALYLEQRVPPPPTLSNLTPPPDDLGIAGARLATLENQAGGRFLGQTYVLETAVTATQEAFLDAARAALVQGIGVLVVNAPSDSLLALADLPEAQPALLFNTAAAEIDLRSDHCRANVLHTLPSRAMLTDALAQFLTRRKWPEAVLISGERPGDQAYAQALRNSFRKFRLDLRDEKTWRFDADMRRNAAQEVPLFTQDFPRHDVVLIADEAGDFGRYVAYNTWLSRPVAGTEGLVAAAWSPVVEQWGAAQLQARFAKLAGRGMLSEDYAAWAALRAVAEAVARTNATDAKTLRAYMLSDAFELAAFKGRPLSFRPWNGQLRQPIPLTTDRALVAQAPIEGFLHQHNELDTLGLDRPESKCTAFE